MFYVILDGKTDTYYNKDLDIWSHLVNASFFDLQNQADVLSDMFNETKEYNTLTLRENEDLSKANMRDVIEALLLI